MQDIVLAYTTSLVYVSPQKRSLLPLIYDFLAVIWLHILSHTLCSRWDLSINCQWHCYRVNVLGYFADLPSAEREEYIWLTLLDMPIWLEQGILAEKKHFLLYTTVLVPLHLKRKSADWHRWAVVSQTLLGCPGGHGHGVIKEKLEVTLCVSCS